MEGVASEPGSRVDEPHAVPLQLEAAGVKIYFLHGVVESELQKTRYNSLFDVAYLSHSFAHALSTPALHKSLQDNARIVAETCRFQLTKSKEQRQAHVSRLQEIGANFKWQPVPSDPLLSMEAYRQDGDESEPYHLVWSFSQSV